MSDKKDLTFVGDLSEFIHTEDADIDGQLDHGTDGPETPPEAPELPSVDLDDLDDDTFDPPSLEEEDLAADEDEITPEFDQLEDSAFDEDDQMLMNDDTQTDIDDLVDQLHEEDSEEEPIEEISLDDTDHDFGDDEVDSGEEEAPYELDEMTNFDDDGELLDESEEKEEIQEGPEDYIEEEASFDDQDELEDEAYEGPIEITEEEPQEQISPVVEAPPTPTITPSIVPKEKLTDVKQFANALASSKVTMEGNPPYSLVISKVKYQEEAQDILSILKEHGLLDGEAASAIKSGIENGSALLSHLSEFAAIYLSHRMRRFDVDLKIGLSDEIHPSSHYQSDQKGLVSRHSLEQNKALTHDRDISGESRRIENIIVSTTPQFEGLNIIDYLGIVRTTILLEEYQLYPERFEQDDENPIGQIDYYHQALEDLKLKAMDKGANGILSVQYNIQSLDQNQFVLEAIGNLVIVEGQ